MKLLNYVGGQWVEGKGNGQPLYDPVLGDELARVSTDGIDFGEALRYARQIGGPALRQLSFAERAGLLGRITEVLSANRAIYFDISQVNSGATETDAAYDVDGAIFTLKYFARTGAGLGDARYLKDGDLVKLGKDDGFQALHIGAPVRGVALLINAFNFPAWGLWEKAAPALLSGVPVVVKPASATAWLTQRMVQDVIEAGILPEGALSIICGSARDLLDQVNGDDALSFTGSAETAARIRSHPCILQNNPRINVEADSLNSAILGPDAMPGTVEFDLLVKEVVREMTVKAGQKCTAIRRILVPVALYDSAADAIATRLSRVVVGNPRNKGVRMGPLVNKDQQQAAITGLQRLKSEASVVFNGGADFRPVDADPDRAAFIAPTLLACKDPTTAKIVHEVEVFGPVATLIPYTDANQAIQIARMGQGSLVASIFSADSALIEQMALNLADSHGRILTANADVAQTSTGHGNVMPMCLHGGPGRAGGGEELGGMRALYFYHRRCALQGPTARLLAIARQAVELTF